MLKLPDGWHLAHDRDPEKELVKLRSRFSAVTRAYEKRIKSKRHRKQIKSVVLTISSGLIAGSCAYYFGLISVILELLPSEWQWLAVT
jgi:hypothetical protein